jgi:hypothetical protein
VAPAWMPVWLHALCAIWIATMLLLGWLATER